MRYLLFLAIVVFLFRKRRNNDDKTEIFAQLGEAEARRQRLLEARIEELEKSAFA